MPVYTYRREDGTTFDIRQKFSDDPLTVDPETGQPVVRVVQAAGIIFKGSGFYVTDNKSSSKATTNGSNGNGNGHGENGSSETKAEKKTEASSEKKGAAAKSDNKASASTPAAKS